jgi:hypothetical protein
MNIPGLYSSVTFTFIGLGTEEYTNTNEYSMFSCSGHTMMGPHRKMGIYVGYHSPSIIKYMEPMAGDLFTA